MKTGLLISIALWVTTIIISFIIGRMKYKSKRLLTTTNVLFVGTFLSAAILFIPIYLNEFASDGRLSQLVKTLLLSLHHAIRLFVVGSDFNIISVAAEELDSVFSTVFSTYASVIFIVAPILTFDFILSFFKNISAYRKYLMGYFSDAYVFSELNERSLALADSILCNNRRNIIVFTDVFEKIEEANYELIERAKELGAICFKNDVLSINFRLHSKRKTLAFFAIGEDETENIKQSFGIIEHYNTRKNTRLYMFSTSTDGELIMTSANKGEVKVKRIKDIRSLIYRSLYDMEETVIEQRNSGVPEADIKKDIFMNALPAEDGMKQIGAVVIGCGHQGTEMIKALTWFCQMDGYRVSIDAFDKDEKAESKFRALCPELMSDKYNGVYVNGEAQYMIHIHSGYDTDTYEFAESLKKLKETTYVFVSLGSDEQNIKVAVSLRTIFEQMNIHPIIQAVVYSTEKKNALEGVKNYGGQAYDIDFVGDLSKLYSENVIIDSGLEREALERHLKWGNEEEFWAYEYNYRSSMASALHMSARIACGIKGAEKKEDELTEEENGIIEQLEHRRWNAYMRSEGYVYSGSPDKSSRNDLGKMHHNLVSFDELSEEDIIKDRRVGTK